MLQDVSPFSKKSVQKKPLLQPKKMIHDIFPPKKLNTATETCPDATPFETFNATNNTVTPNKPNTNVQCTSLVTTPNKATKDVQCASLVKRSFCAMDDGGGGGDHGNPKRSTEKKHHSSNKPNNTTIPNNNPTDGSIVNKTIKKSNPRIVRQGLLFVYKIVQMTQTNLPTTSFQIRCSKSTRKVS